MLHEATPLATVIFALLLGMHHATDPDHVIAVTTIMGNERRLRSATRIGAVWGIGHSFTMLLVGSAIICLKLTFPARVDLALEFAVAVFLILLGAGATSGLLGSVARRVFAGRDRLVVNSRRSPSDAGLMHSHALAHGDHEHSHFPGVAGPGRRRQMLGARHRMVRSFGMGLVHGLAGSAAMALVVLAAIPSPLWAVCYLVVFCGGTVLGMALLTTAMATPFIMGGRRVAWLHEAFVTGAGVLSFVFGLCLAYQIGIAEGLLL